MNSYAYQCSPFCCRYVTLQKFYEDDWVTVSHKSLYL